MKQNKLLGAAVNDIYAPYNYESSCVSISFVKQTDAQISQQSSLNP